MKYLDQVEVIRDREEYAKQEVYKGMIGTIIDAELRFDRFHVIFSDPITKEPGFEFTDENIKKIKDDILHYFLIEDLKVIKESYATDEEILDALPKKNPDWWCKVENGYILNLKDEKKNKIAYDYKS